MLLCAVIAFSLVARGPRPTDATLGADGSVSADVANPDGGTRAEGGSATAGQPAVPDAEAQNRPADGGTDLVTVQDSVDIEALRANPAGEYVPETSELEEGVSYEPQVALARLADGARAEDVRQALAERAGLEPGSFEAYEFSPGYLHISLPEGYDVAWATDVLSTLEAVAAAEPNYYLYLASDTTTNGADGKRAVASSTDELDPVRRNDATGAETESTGTQESSGPKESGQTDSGALPSENAGIESSDSAVEEMGVDGEKGATASDAGESRVSQNGSASLSVGEGEKPVSAGEMASTEDVAGPQLEAQGGSSEAAATLGAQATRVDDKHRDGQWGLDSISINEAWDLAKVNRSVTVAVLDLGFDLEHEDLKQNFVGAYNSYNAYRGGSTTDVTPPSSGTEHKHGTHVAGIIAAVANNKIGIAGASYNARVMPIKVVGPTNGATIESIVKAYDYILSNASKYNVRVVNLSMGVKGEIADEDLVYRKIDEAYNRGIVTVTAAGNNANSGPYYMFPGDYEKTVNVISLKENGSITNVAKAASSNYNAKGEQTKNISAPGVGILSTIPSNEYESMNGTSMAAPHVSAVLALEFAAKPSLSAADAVSTLYATARDIGASGWDNTYGWGEVNAYYALLGLTKGVDKAKMAQVEAMERKGAETAKQNRIDNNVASGLSYSTHVQNAGWRSYVKNGATSGTTGSSLRLEGIKIRLASIPYSGTIQYRTHIQNIGWQAWKSNDVLSGTSGQSLRLEAIQIRLTGEMANHYDIWYHVHAQDIGWMGWTKNGEASGTAGYGRRLEAIQILIRPKGSVAPGSTSGAFTFPISYQTHVQNVGWQGLVSNGSVSGTSGQSLRLEGITVNVPNLPFSGTVQYRTHVQNIGWEGSWRTSGQMSGTSGQSLRLEAIQIKLTGELSNRYDVWYRTHVQNYGWTGWAKNGASSGSAGKGYRLEGIQIWLSSKNGAAPGSTANAFYQ